MKHTVLTLAVLLTCSFLATGAQASRDEYYEHGERYEHGREYSGEGYSTIKFYGVIEAMPQGGVIGTWRISGRDVIVTQRTFIKQEYGPLALGAQVEVKGGGNPFTAYEIEVKGRASR
jgi:hypothetical protein